MKSTYKLDPNKGLALMELCEVGMISDCGGVFCLAFSDSTSLDNTMSIAGSLMAECHGKIDSYKQIGPYN